MNRWLLGLWCVGIWSLSSSLVAQEISPPPAVPRVAEPVSSPAAAVPGSPPQAGFASLQIAMLARLLPVGSTEEPPRRADGAGSATSSAPAKVLSVGGPAGQLISTDEATRLLAAYRADPAYCFLSESVFVLPLGERGKFRNGSLSVPSEEAISAFTEQLSAPNTGSSSGLSEAERSALAAPEFFGTQVEATVTRLQPDTLRVLFSVNHSARVDAGPRELPTKQVRCVSSRVDLKAGQTLQLSGLRSRETTVATTRIPWLSNIPAIGDALFTKTTTEERESELIVLITVAPVTPDQW